jgi:choice-of-anchor C domain-containing protein
MAELCSSGRVAASHRPHPGLAGLVILALACALGPIRASASLVQDGSFEGRVAASPFETFVAGQTFGGWTVTAGSVDLINGAWLAASGNQSVDMSGGTHGTIQQTINVPAGYYRLTFDLSGNSDGPPAIKTVLVSFGSASAQFSFTTPDGNNGNMQWTSEAWDFYLPVGGNKVLSFADISGGVDFQTSFGAALDNVSLIDPPPPETAPVPESGTMLAGALLLVPFGASAVRILRRKHAPRRLY